MHVDIVKVLPGKAVIHYNLADMKDVLNALIYQKGGWTLHMLRGLMGTEPFQDGIRDYYRRSRDRNTTTAEFRQIMEEHASRDLRWFFDQWLTRAGHPVLEGTWEFDSAGKRIIVELRATNPGASYRLPLEIGIGGEGTTPARVERIEMLQREQRFEIPADRAPTSVRLDPGTWALIEARFGPK